MLDSIIFKKAIEDQRRVICSSPFFSMYYYYYYYMYLYILEWETTRDSPVVADTSALGSFSSLWNFDRSLSLSLSLSSSFPPLFFATHPSTSIWYYCENATPPQTWPTTSSLGCKTFRLLYAHGISRHLSVYVVVAR